MRALKFLALALVVISAGSPRARAALTMTFTWDQTYYQSGYSATYINTSDAIGIYHFNTSGDGVDVPSSYWSVCVSPNGLLDGNPHTYNVLSFAQANPGIYPSAWAWDGSSSNPQYWGINNAAYLWNRYGMDIVNNTGAVGYQSQRATALEFAVWTALYDSKQYGQLGSAAEIAANHGVYWTAPQMDATTLGWYTTYINALTSSGLTHALYDGNILESDIAKSGPDSGGSQEFLLLGISHNNVSPVPEPTTMIAGAFALLLCAGLACSKQKAEIGTKDQGP